MLRGATSAKLISISARAWTIRGRKRRSAKSCPSLLRLLMPNTQKVWLQSHAWTTFSLAACADDSSWRIPHRRRMRPKKYCEQTVATRLLLAVKFGFAVVADGFPLTLLTATGYGVRSDYWTFLSPFHLSLRLSPHRYYDNDCSHLLVQDMMNVRWQSGNSACCNCCNLARLLHVESLLISALRTRWLCTFGPRKYFLVV